MYSDAQVNFFSVEPKSETAWLLTLHIFNLTRYYQRGLQSVYNDSHSHQKCTLRISCIPTQTK